MKGVNVEWSSSQLLKEVDLNQINRKEHIEGLKW